MRRPALIVAGVLAVLLLGGFAFAGDKNRLPDGTKIAGIDVGGRTRASAVALLKAKTRATDAIPLTVIAGGKRFQLRSDQLGFAPDWEEAVDAAAEHGNGPVPLRGFRRLWTSVAGLDVHPRVRYWQAAVAFELNRIAKTVDHPRREATLALHGRKPVVEPGLVGEVLDQDGAKAALLDALVRFSREPVVLPVVKDEPRVVVADLRPVAAQVRVALSAPVKLVLGPTAWRIPTWRLAQVLELPSNGSRRLAIGGTAATAWLHALDKRASSPARDADWAADAKGNVRIVPAQPGVHLDLLRSARVVLRAALSRANRVATLETEVVAPRRTTEQAARMGITGTVGTYETFYTGIPNRLHNVRLVAHLVDDKLIPPGAVFSFNKATGERSAEKGFLEAPVIINGELQNGLGGGVCQVSTTVFNAAYEGGLPIVERTNHALYISHYPQGRDATVNYPDVDLKFRNDTGHWLLLRMTIGSSSLVATLYGAPQHRRVESVTSPLVATGGPPLKKVKDPTLLKGKTVVEESGSPSLSTSVERTVYGPDGKELYDDVFRSHYVAEAKVVRVGTKKPPKEKPAATTTTSTTTDTTGTGTVPTDTVATTTTEKPPTD